VSIAQFQRFLIAVQCHTVLKAPRGETIFRTVLRKKTVRAPRRSNLIASGAVVRACVCSSRRYRRNWTRSCCSWTSSRHSSALALRY
jgi:hypothetical protein